MDTVLLIIGVLGFGAVVIAAYVFMIAARNYVTETGLAEPANPLTSAATAFIQRSPRNRRQLVQFDFPMTLNGLLVPAERRVLGDRRLANA